MAISKAKPHKPHKLYYLFKPFNKQMSSTNATIDQLLTQIAALTAEVTSLKAAVAVTTVAATQTKPLTAPEAQAAALKARAQVNEPPAKFNNARQNALYYKSHAKFYKMSDAEAATLKETTDKANAKKIAAVYHMWAVRGTADEAAANSAYLIAEKERRNCHSIDYAIHKEHERYVMYYFGTFASEGKKDDIKRFLIWRYYVFQFAEDDDMYMLCKPKPIGLLNPHAYFAARRQGRRDFLSFVDKTQPPPKLPKTEEAWKFGEWKYENEIREHINDDNWDNWDASEDGNECSGCHFCAPEEYPEAPSKVAPLPAGHVLVLHHTTRAHSSGSENHYTSLFGSYEAASKAILEMFEPGGDARESWSEEDMHEDECDTDGDYMEEPTVAWACKKFNPAALVAMNIMGYEQKLYGPYSEFCVHCPYELHISLCEIH